MDEQPEPPPEDPSPPSPAGLDESEFFAAERVFEHLATAVERAQNALNLAEVLRVQTVLAAWDAMVLDEQAHGRMVHLGGVQEKAFGIHLGALLSVSPRSARALLHDADLLRTRLPRTWTGFCAGGFAWAAAVIVADSSAGLGGDALARFDEEAAVLAVETPQHQLERKLMRLRDRLDAEAAAGAAKAADRRRRVTAAPAPDGQGTLTLHGPQTDIAAMYDVVHQLAVAAHGRDGETRGLGALMFDVTADLVLRGAANPPESDPSFPAERLGDLRVPGRKAVQATLLVLAPAATACGTGSEPARLAGWGSLTAEEVRRLVSTTTHWTRVLVDPIDDAVLGIDSTERYIPSGLRKLLQARDEHCQGPGCSRPGHRCDADHAIRFEHGGPTAQWNLSVLCRSDHIAKDAGYVDVRRRDDGALVWRTRWGATVVTPSGLDGAPKPKPRRRTSAVLIGSDRAGSYSHHGPREWARPLSREVRPLGHPNFSGRISRSSYTRAYGHAQQSHLALAVVSR